MSETSALIECNKGCPLCCSEVDEINAKVMGAMRIIGLLLFPIILFGFIGVHVYFALIEKQFCMPAGMTEIVYASMIMPWAGESANILIKKFKGSKE